MPSRAEEQFNQITNALDPIAAIENMVVVRERESEFLEFKRKGDESTDKRYWCQALSGFANTEGGVIIFGVGTDKVPNEPHPGKIDAASERKPFDDPEGFVEFLRRQFLHTTVELVHGVVMKAYLKPNTTKGYVVCFIPEGDHRPYRDVAANQYWIRVQDNFVAMPHQMLRAMFYPMVTPNLQLLINWNSQSEFILSVVNRGTATAQDLEVATITNPKCEQFRQSPYNHRFAHLHPDRDGRIVNVEMTDAKRFWMVEMMVGFYSHNHQPQFYRLVLPYDYNGSRKNGDGFTITEIDSRGFKRFTQELSWAIDSPLTALEVR